LVEEDRRYFLTETDKHHARIHELPTEVVEGLWGQLEDKPCRITREGLLLELAPGAALPPEVPMPELPEFYRRDSNRADYGMLLLRTGFTIELWLRLDSLEAGQMILDSRREDGQGLALQTTPQGTVELILRDRQTENRWDCDPGQIMPGSWHHLVAIVDGGPHIISFVVDGRLNDGGDLRQFGWGRFSPHLRHVSGSATLRLGPSLRGELGGLRLYGRALRTAEAIANFRAGRP